MEHDKNIPLDPAPGTTDRQHPRGAILDSEARLRAVVDSAVDGIITINEVGTIESVNIAGLDAFGYTREELIGQNVKVLIPEPYFGEHDGYLSNYRTSGRRKIIGIGREVMGKRKDGSSFPADLAVSEVQLADRRLFTGIVRDITERKEAERALVQAKEAAERASRAKDDFLSVLSHELRTPLTPVLAALSLIEQDPSVPPQVGEQLAMIRRNVEMEARLVDDLLDLTRIAQGKIQLRHEAIDAHAIVRHVISMFQNEIEKKCLTITTSLRARESFVWADPSRFQQVLMNLASNAVKFTPPDGSITVRTSNENGGIKIEVTDTGIGIEPDMLPRLFRPFEQGERTVTRRFGGLGLGLSIVKSLAEMHKATITATSEGKDKGASFALFFETIDSGYSHAAPATIGTAPAKAARVLLVEDHEDTRRVMSKVLTTFGFTVTATASVKEAVEAADRMPFDLLLSDLGLPDGSGHDVMKHMASKFGIAGIAISGFGQEEDLRRSREAGFAMHLTKPVSMQNLLTAINSMGQGQ